MNRKLKIDPGFSPCPAVTGDEHFANGIFVFNISEMLKYIQDHPGSIALEEVLVSDHYRGASTIDETYLDTVDISKPVILAEIAPARYNLIDGHHRIEKAVRMGLKSIKAYKFHPEQHIRFLTEKRGYLAYVEYWNDKLDHPY